MDTTDIPKAEDYERDLRSMSADDLLREIAMNTMATRVAVMACLFELQDMTSAGDGRKVVNVYDHGRDELPH